MKKFLIGLGVVLFLGGSSTFARGVSIIKTEISNLETAKTNCPTGRGGISCKTDKQRQIDTLNKELETATNDLNNNTSEGTATPVSSTCKNPTNNDLKNAGIKLPPEPKLEFENKCTNGSPEEQSECIKDKIQELESQKFTDIDQSAINDFEKIKCGTNFCGTAGNEACEDKDLDIIDTKLSVFNDNPSIKTELDKKRINSEINYKISQYEELLQRANLETLTNNTRYFSVTGRGFEDGKITTTTNQYHGLRAIVKYDANGNIINDPKAHTGEAELHLRVDGENQEDNLLQRVIRVIIQVLGTTAVLFLIVGGFFMITSQGDENQLQKGKTIVEYTAIGVIVAFLSYAIVTFVISIIMNYQ